MKRVLALVSAVAALAIASAASAQPRFDHAITNVPGKSLVAVEVNYAPGQASPSHRHAGSAFIMAYVVSGSIVSQVEGQPERTYKAGETWYEDPGAHHVVSRNASATEPAKLLAVFVVDTADRTLTTPDR
jgi:quercetin dioxygenase-like cupin family protein